MSETTSEIQQIQAAIDALRRRVERIGDEEPADEAVDRQPGEPSGTSGAEAPAGAGTAVTVSGSDGDRAAAPPADVAASAPAPARTEPADAVAAPPRREPADGPGQAGPGGRADKATAGDALAVLRAGMAELDALTELKEVPQVFARFAARTGLRLLLLKLWRSGLQVVEARGISLPGEAFHKTREGRAPIPVQEDELFCVLSREPCVYAGPVPLRRFPLDMTILLRQGDGGRQIVVLPLKFRGHWNVFLYLDADRGGERALGVAEVLARYALARILLLEKGLGASAPGIGTILKEELERRQEQRARRLDRDRPRRGGATAGDGSAETDDLLDGDLEAARTSIGEAARREAERRRLEGLEPDPDEVRLRAEGLTPEAVLSHTGELPALPKAACHILAVIDDPRTTATRLEKAIALDQALTAKVLRIANSPFYGAARDIKTVSEAIVRLGFMTIRNWTLVAATKSIFLTPGAGLLHRKVWRQSVLSAMATQLVAQDVRFGEPEAVFLGGLMQNIGQLVLARAEPDLFLRVLEESERRAEAYHVVERDLLGFDHGELGALLIREWNLDRELEEAVRDHHRLEGEGAARRMAAMIWLGEELAATSGSGELGVPSSWETSRPATILGLDAERYEALRAAAAELAIDTGLFV